MASVGFRCLCFFSVILAWAEAAHSCICGPPCFPGVPHSMASQASSPLRLPSTPQPGLLSFGDFLTTINFKFVYLERERIQFAIRYGSLIGLLDLHFYWSVHKNILPQWDLGNQQWVFWGREGLLHPFQCQDIKTLYNDIQAARQSVLVLFTKDFCFGDWASTIWKVWSYNKGQ